MADLSTVYTFSQNADAHADFLHRVEAAIVDVALDVRAEPEPDPMTETHRSRQRWAVSALANPVQAAKTMLPGLAIIANLLNLISSAGVIDATDQQITTALTSAEYDLVDKYSDYVPAA